jgi:flagellar motor switch/type III secretory pathway protein FliN
MGTASALPNGPAQHNQVEPTREHDRDETVEQALIPSSQAPQTETLIPSTSVTARLPVEVDVGVPLRAFRVRNLLALEPGTVVESQWANGEDVPLSSGDVQLAWSEFEVIEAQLGVRLTRLV